MPSVTLLPTSGAKLPLRPRLDRLDRPPLTYTLGLIGVAVALLGLPVLYLTTVIGSFWLLYAHLTVHAAWIIGPSLSLPLAALYLALALLLVLLTFFLSRPLLPSSHSVTVDLPLNAEAEPRLHAFVKQICTSLGAPVPVKIHVNMDVNASARFASGLGNFRAGRLELILGLPLVRGLELVQFAAVLAHELGHFRQGTAMRLVHGIRAIIQWFGTAANREDEWEKELAERGYKADPFLFIPGWCAKGCLGLVRKILKAHMRAGQAISCVLLRQMEFEADRAAIRIVGGEVFAAMVLEAKILESAWALANRSLGMALREGRLADDLPALVSAHTRVFIPQVRRKMERSLQKEKSAWIDTHPSLAERVNRARHTAVRGIFHAIGRADTLFVDFPALSRQATRLFYEQDLGGDFNPSRMVSTSDLVTGQSEIQLGEAALNGYFLGLLSNLRPLWIVENDLEKEMDGTLLRESLQTARATLEMEVGRASELFGAYASSDSRILDSVQAISLLRANFWIEPTDFQMPMGGLTQAGIAFRKATETQQMISEDLIAFENAMVVRMVSALALLADPQVMQRLQDAHVSALQVRRLLPSLSGIRNIHPRLEAMRRTVYGMAILLDNQKGNEKSPELRTQLHTQTLAIRVDMDAIGVALSGYEYPFGSHSNGSGLAGYALDKLPAEHDHYAHYIAAEEVLGRCYALYFRIMGKLALAAGQVEGVLGLGPLQIDPIE